MARADQVLVARGLFESRAKAQEAIAAGLVLVGGKPVRKPSETISEAAQIEAKAAHPWVSRGGIKLAHALDTFGVEVGGATCLDVGASTGGFSHVLLSRGAKQIYAVDTGRDQFHASLRGNERISLHEQTDIRTVKLPELSDIAVIDVSFIPLLHIVPAVLAQLKPEATLIALIKPQFEAGKKDIGKGGIVKDASVHSRVCAEIATGFAALGAPISTIIESPIHGGDGNREFLALARRTP